MSDHVLLTQDYVRLECPIRCPCMFILRMPRSVARLKFGSAAMHRKTERWIPRQRLTEARATARKRGARCGFVWTFWVSEIIVITGFGKFGKCFVLRDFEPNIFGWCETLGHLPTPLYTCVFPFLGVKIHIFHRWKGHFFGATNPTWFPLRRWAQPFWRRLVWAVHRRL